MKKLLLIILLIPILVGCKKEIIYLKFQKEVVNEIVNNTYKNDFLKNSYELSNFKEWYSSDSIYENNIKYQKNNPLTDVQSVQIDINGDGIEDIFAYDGYDLRINPTPNPPPAIYLSNLSGRLDRTIYTGPNIKTPHGTKILLGDFNNDSICDMFSLVAIDQPFGVLYPSLKNVSHFIFNSKTNQFKIREIELDGFWFSGCSGDIDNDGDLDIIMFNMHQEPPIGNGIKNRILFNDGIGNFKHDTTSILSDYLSVTASELFDINKDGYLDLIINNKLKDKSELKIFWGTDKLFDSKNSITLSVLDNKEVVNLDFVNLFNDNLFEIIVFDYSNVTNKFEVEIFEIYDLLNVKNKTSNYFIDNKTIRFASLRVQDIDKNGFIDLFSSNKSDKIRWEWDGKVFNKK